MNKKILFSICIIFVALIGIGFASAADTHNSTLSDRPTIAVDQNNVDLLHNQNDVNRPDVVIIDSPNGDQAKLVRPDSIVNDDINNVQGKLVRPDSVASDNKTNETIIVDKNTTDMVPANEITINNTDADNAAAKDIKIVKNNSTLIQSSNAGQSSAGKGFYEIEDDFSVMSQRHYTQDELKQMRLYVEYYKNNNYDLRKLVTKTMQDGFVKPGFGLEGVYDAARTICEIHNEAMGMIRSNNIYTPRKVFSYMLYYSTDNFFQMLA